MSCVTLIQNKPVFVRPMQLTDTTAEPAVRPTLTGLFETEESPLLRYAFGVVGRREVAEEIVQEAFMQLHRHWESVETPRGWIYRSVRNLALNHLRDHRREQIDSEAGVTSVDEREAPDAELARMEAVGYLKTLIEELDVEDRQLVRLKFDEHLSYGAISERTGLTAGNVGYRLHHLLKGLSESLRRVGIEGITG
jgi:RNA polymerase sigma factor (sigma-70 family)